MYSNLAKCLPKWKFWENNNSICIYPIQIPGNWCRIKPLIWSREVTWSEILFAQVVGHRPVCSCPSGSHNINNSCTSDTSCQWDDRRYDSGEHYYDDNCEHRCECYNGEFICQPTTCQAGLKPKGQLTKEVKLINFLKSQRFHNRTKDVMNSGFFIVSLN